METIPLTEPACLLIDEDIAAAAMLTAEQKENILLPLLKKLVKDIGITGVVLNKQIPKEYADLYDIELASQLFDDLEGCISLYSFEGFAETILPESVQNPIKMEFNDDFILYLQADKEPSPFKAAYESPEELEREFRNKLRGIIPDDFPIRRYIVQLHGSI